MASGIGLPAYVEEVPEYRVVEGRMHITLGDVELVMPIHIFEAGALRGKEAIAKWRAKQLGKVRPIRRRH